jgi:GNAT superfamily N-acetyltransferase
MAVGDPVTCVVLPPAEDAEILALLGRVYPGSPIHQDPARLGQYWGWRYRHGRSAVADEIVLGARTPAGELVGVRPVSIVPAVLTGRPALLGILSSVATSPQHRGRGVFRTLSGAAESLLAERGVPLALTFPNQRSHPLYQRRGDWRDHGDLPQLLGPAAGIGVARRSPAETSWIEAAAECWTAVAPSVAMGVARTAELLRWRYLDHPWYRYDAVVERDEAGKPQGFAVCRVVSERGRLWARVGLVFELFAARGESATLTRLWRGCARCIRERGGLLVHLLTADAGAFPLSTRLANAIVALPRGLLRSLKCVSLPLGPSAAPPLGPGCYLGWGDTDSA